MKKVTVNKELKVGIVSNNWTEFEMKIKDESKKRFIELWKKSGEPDENLTLGEINMLNMCLMVLHEQVKNI